MHQIRIDFSERDKDKLPFVKEWVGDHEISCLNLLFIEEEEVKIDHSGTPSKGLPPAKIQFKSLDRSEELMGLEVRLNLNYSIDEPVLVGVTQGLCFIKGGLG